MTLDAYAPMTDAKTHALACLVSTLAEDAVFALASGGGVAEGEAAPFLQDLEAEGVVERVADGDGGAVTLPGAPAVVWREELHRFGGCSFMPQESTLCDQNPQTS